MRVALLALALCASSAAAGHFSLTQMHRAKHLEARAASRSHAPSGIATFWFDQVLDHFSPTDTRTWKQRYFVNDQYHQGSTSPVFLQIGGEGAIGTNYVEPGGLQYSVYAKEHNAILVAVEHRFYGESQPLPDLSDDSLKYLSSMQALEDVQNLIQWLRKNHPLITDESPFVIFGCSYSGAMTSWFKMKYPFSAIGAVAGSGPVQAELDFFQYLETIEQSLTFFSGPECDANVKAATDAVEELLQTSSGQAKVQSLFNTCTVPSDPLDIATLMNNLMGNWMEIVQYNDEGFASTDATKLCAMMNATSDPLTNYVTVSNMFLEQSGQSCMDIAYTSQVDMLKNTTQPASGVGIRSWTYQTCTEFGYYQTTDASTDVQPFGNLVPLNYSLQLCKDGFSSLPSDYDFQAAIDATNTQYGGQNITGTTNTIFIDGTIDPWRPLTVHTPPTPSSPVITITGTAHCATCNPVTPSDPPGQGAAYKQVSGLLGQWIAAAAEDK